MDSDLRQLEDALNHDTFMVRHYAPGRTEAMRLRRAQAILKLGLTVRHVFAVSDNFEPLLTTLVDGLRPRDTRPF